MKLKTCLKYLDDHFEECVCAFLLSILMSSLFIQVFSRFVLNPAWSWQEELSHIIFVCFIYMGLSLGAKQHGHIRITSFINLFPSSWREVIKITSDVIWLVFNFAVIVISVELLKTMVVFPYRSAALNWDMFWVYLVIPFSFVMVSYRILQYYYRKFKSRVV